METFSLSMETFPLYGDFTGTLRGLFSMETFSLSMDFSQIFCVHGTFCCCKLISLHYSLGLLLLALEVSEMHNIVVSEIHNIEVTVWFRNRTANRETNRKHRNRTGTVHIHEPNRWETEPFGLRTANTNRLQTG